jgi:hypothetical protein
VPVRLHLDALVLMLRVWAGYGLLTAASLAILAVGAEGALVRSGALDAQVGTVYLLAGCATVLAIGGATAWLAARGLQQRRTEARRAALVLAVVNLLIVPFGTALAVYTFWVLLNDDARREFGRPPRGSALAR